MLPILCCNFQNAGGGHSIFVPEVRDRGPHSPTPKGQTHLYDGSADTLFVLYDTLTWAICFILVGRS